MTDHDLLLVEEAFSGVEDSLPPRGRSRRFVVAAFVSAAAACVAVAFLSSSGSPTSNKINKQAVSQLAEFEPMKSNNEETKEVYHKIPIYKTGNGGHHIKDAADGVKDWTVFFEEGSTSDDIDKTLENLPEGLKVIYHPDNDGGAEFVVIEGTLEDLEKYIDDNGLSGDMFIEEDGDMEIIHEAPSDSTEESDEEESRRLAESWGIDRIDERNLPLDGDYNAGSRGRGAHVYICDTGVRTTHNDFQGRAIPTLEVVGNGIVECDPSDTRCADDTNGHGTHCAGTVGGKSYGVAKGATLHAVQVLADSGSGSFTWFNMALNWISTKGKRPAVASASLGGRAKVSSTSRVITDILNKGVVVVVAAGNEGESSIPNACEYTPAFVPAAITVGSSTSRDNRSPFSNYGDCVDIFAPGSAIQSASHQSDGGTAGMSGTSMACPHVAGACALLLAAGTEPASVSSELKRQSSRDKIHDARPNLGTPNELLFVDGGDGGGETPEKPPEKPPVDEACSEVGWKVTEGACKVDSDCCLTSPGYPNNYDDDETCTISVGNDPGRIDSKDFQTEHNFDKLLVSGDQLFSGSGGPHDVIPTGTIKWLPDSSVTKKGFKLCLPQRGGVDTCDENVEGAELEEDYKGCQTKTREGNTCMKWTDQSPHTHTRTPDKYPNRGLGNHNFCRNPGGQDEGIWCYTTNPDVRWEYCDPIMPDVVEEIGGKKWRPATGCVKDWKFGEDSISGYCTTKSHHTAWCSKDKEYRWEWAECISVE